MSNGGFQEALARLLVSGAARRELVDSTGRFADRYELTPREVRQLGAIDAARLEYTAQGIARLRTRTLGRIFATTFRLGDDPQHMQDALSSFLATDIPEAGADEASRWLAEGERFVAHLSRALAPQIAEFARLELLRFDLLYNQDAEAAARNAEVGALDPDTLADEDLLHRIRPELGRHVRLGAFAFDVLALRPGAASAAEPAPTHVALCRQAPRASVDTYRISELAFTLLRDCDGTRSLAEISTTQQLGGAAELGRFGLTRRLLVDPGPGQVRPTHPPHSTAVGHGRACGRPLSTTERGRR